MRFFLVLVTVISFHLSSAQKKLVPGKIETKTGQLIDGKIFFKDRSVTPQEIEFVDQTGRTRTYRPSELRSFEAEGEKFVSEYLTIDATPQSLYKEDYLNRTAQTADTVFLSLQVIPKS